MKLAVFGDSWTWGDELVDPRYFERDCCDVRNDQHRLEHCFSGRIAQHYNCEYENYGHPGASLQSTVWTFLWWLQQDIKHEDYVVLVGLTAADRQSWYNPDHVSYSNDPPWNKYIHSTWINFGSSVVPEEWRKLGKDYLTLSHCDELSVFNYQQAVYFFDGIAKTKNLRLGQFNFYRQPTQINASTLWWPEQNMQDYLYTLPNFKELHKPGHHPNENGHQIISKRLITNIDQYILT